MASLIDDQVQKQMKSAAKEHDDNARRRRMSAFTRPTRWHWSSSNSRRQSHLLWWPIMANDGQCVEKEQRSVMVASGRKRWLVSSTFSATAPSPRGASESNGMFYNLVPICTVRSLAPIGGKRRGVILLNSNYFLPSFSLWFLSCSFVVLFKTSHHELSGVSYRIFPPEEKKYIFPKILSFIVWRTFVWIGHQESDSHGNGVIIIQLQYEDVHVLFVEIVYKLINWMALIKLYIKGPLCGISIYQTSG